MRKPVAEDTVTSIEIYTAAGDLALQLFGVRDEAGKEDPRWRSLAESCAAKLP
ncbi:MAG: hypothetical protein ACOC2Y_09510 [Spirochaetota bacterium]